MSPARPSKVVPVMLGTTKTSMKSLSGPDHCSKRSRRLVLAGDDRESPGLRVGDVAAVDAQRDVAPLVDRARDVDRVVKVGVLLASEGLRADARDIQAEAEHRSNRDVARDRSAAAAPAHRDPKREILFAVEFSEDARPARRGEHDPPAPRAEPGDAERATEAAGTPLDQRAASDWAVPELPVEPRIHRHRGGIAVA